MSELIEIKVPDIGEAGEAEVIEILVSEGDTVNVDDPLISVESEKATFDVPASSAGKVREIKLATGDQITEGSLILLLEPAGAATADEPAGQADGDSGDNDTASEDSEAGQTAAQSTGRGQGREAPPDLETELVVLGSGPGGYTAAFRAADLGQETLLVEQYPDLGGVCLNVGCIPSKALLHAADIITEAGAAGAFGIRFGTPDIDLEKLKNWKNKILKQLASGLKGLAKQRNVRILQGRGEFISANRMRILTDSGEKIVGFKQAIIAVGSAPVPIPGLPDDPRIMDSTGALKLESIPKRLLVIGGGIIGLEMATVYHALGAGITVVEMLDHIMAGADQDIVKPLLRRLQKQYDNIYLGTQVTGVEANEDGLVVGFEGSEAPEKAEFDQILVAVGRRPNGGLIGADKAGINIDDQGFIAVDKQQRTNVPHIFAIGDVVGQPMLAHKSTHEGKVAAEVAAGLKSGFDARVIPSVAYTNPEVAWVGLTETEAREQGKPVGKGVFPWAASGRSLTLGRNDGVTKLLFDEDSGQLLGAGIAGPNAGDLIAEAALAIEMGCDAEDVALTVHPHPTLSETLAFASEAFSGTITDLYMPKKQE